MAPVLVCDDVFRLVPDNVGRLTELDDVVDPVVVVESVSTWLRFAEMSVYLRSGLGRTINRRGYEHVTRVVKVDVNLMIDTRYTGLQYVFSVFKTLL